MAKILVVDDSEALRAQLRKDLEGASHEAVEASDGLAGIEALRSNPDIGLILCDVNMPRLDGLSMCERISVDTTLPKVPILMLTTESDALMKARGKQAGVVAWVTKPYVAAKLLGAITQLLARRTSV